MAGSYARARTITAGRPVEMPKVGLEPTRPEGHRILSPARLPVPPLRPHGIVALGLIDLLSEGGFAGLPGGTGCSPDAEREVRGAEQEADASAPFARAAFGHPERGAGPVRGMAEGRTGERGARV